MKRYLVQRREVLGPETRVHYHAGTGIVAANRWMPDPGQAFRYSYAEARSLAKRLSRALPHRYNVFFKTVPEGGEA
jgi:hypothetical protein